MRCTCARHPNKISCVWAVDLPQVPPLASEGAACCYICDLANTPGRFLPEKAAAMGVPKGPMFGQLKGGQAVVLPDGKAVQPADVTLPTCACPKACLVSCVALPAAHHVAGEERCEGRDEVLMQLPHIRSTQDA